MESQCNLCKLFKENKCTGDVYLYNCKYFVPYNSDKSFKHISECILDLLDKLEENSQKESLSKETVKKLTKPIIIKTPLSDTMSYDEAINSIINSLKEKYSKSENECDCGKDCDCKTDCKDDFKDTSKDISKDNKIDNIVEIKVSDTSNKADDKKIKTIVFDNVSKDVNDVNNICKGCVKQDVCSMSKGLTNRVKNVVNEVKDLPVDIHIECRKYLGSTPTIK